MTKRNLELRIKLIKDRLTLAQLYKEEFRRQLGIVGYDEFIDTQLDELKVLLELHKKFNDEEN